MTEQQDREIATLLMIPAFERTAMQRQRIDELEGIWEAEQQRFSVARWFFLPGGLRVPGCADILA